MIASDTLFDSRGWVFGVKLSDEDTADFEVLRDVAMATIFAFYIWGAHWRHLKNTTEPSMSCGDAALCQITLTTCFSICSLVFILHEFEVAPSPNREQNFPDFCTLKCREWR